MGKGKSKGKDKGKRGPVGDSHRVSVFKAVPVGLAPEQGNLLTQRGKRWKGAPIGAPAKVATAPQATAKAAHQDTETAEVLEEQPLPDAEDLQLGVEDVEDALAQNGEELVEELAEDADAAAALEALEALQALEALDTPMGEVAEGEAEPEAVTEDLQGLEGEAEADAPQTQHQAVAVPLAPIAPIGQGAVTSWKDRYVPFGRPKESRPLPVFERTASEAEIHPIFSGRIKNISRGKGFGFIACADTWKLYGRDVVVLPEKLGKFREGDGVVFQVKVEAGEPRGYNLTALPGLGLPAFARSAEVPTLPPPRVPHMVAEPPSLEVIGRPGSAPHFPSVPSAPSVPIGAAEGRPKTEEHRQVPPKARSVFTSQRTLPKVIGSSSAIPPLGRRGNQGEVLVPKMAVGCSQENLLPKHPSPALPSATPGPSAPCKTVPAVDTKKRSFDELFEKTKARLETLQAKKEVEVAPPPMKRRVAGPSLDKALPPAPPAPPRPLAMPAMRPQAPGRPRPPARPPAPLPAVPAVPPAPLQRRPLGQVPQQRMEVLLLDVVPNSAGLVESLREEILARPGVNKMHFAQPAGNLNAPWRAEILGLPEALQEVKTFLTNTLEYGAVRVVGFDIPKFEAESNLCVTVRGLQEAFGQGGACAALMACGRVLQWIKAGEDAYCWLTSAEAVWVAQQFLHGAVCSNGTASSVLPDEATREAVSRWRERRRSALATPGPRGDWRLPTDEELDNELLTDQTIQAAKGRLEDFLSYVAQVDSYADSDAKEQRP